MTDASSARTRQTHRSDAATALARSAMHEPRTARLATTPARGGGWGAANETTLPTPPHAREVVRNPTRRSSSYTTSNHALQAEPSPMHANSPTHMPVHLRCTQNEYQREAMRYARSHIITQSCEQRPSRAKHTDDLHNEPRYRTNSSTKAARYTRNHVMHTMHTESQATRVPLHLRCTQNQA